MRPLLGISGLPSSNDNPMGMNLFYGPSTIYGRCPGCGNPQSLIQIDFDGCEVVLTGEKTTSSFHHWVYAPGKILISRRMLDDCESEGITGYKAHPVRIERVDAPGLAGKPIPEYFFLEVTGRFDVDRFLFDEYDGILCSVCKKWRPRKGGKVSYGDKIVYPRLDKWDGSDWLEIGNISFGGYYCSRRLAEFGHRKGWYNWGVQAGYKWDLRVGFRGSRGINLDNPNWVEELDVAARARFGDIVGYTEKGVPIQR